MSAVLAILVLVAFLAAWWRFLYVRSGRRLWRPLWLAFTATFAAVLFLVTGSIGYTLDRHARFVNGVAWSDSVIWWQISVGLAAAIVAALFWHKALRATHHP